MSLQTKSLKVILIQKFLNCEFIWSKKKPTGKYSKVKKVKDLPENEIKNCLIYMGICCGLSFCYSDNWLLYVYKKYF